MPRLFVLAAILRAYKGGDPCVHVPIFIMHALIPDILSTHARLIYTVSPVVP